MLLLALSSYLSSAGSATHAGRTFSSCDHILYDIGIGICILPSILPSGLLSTAVRIDVNTLVTNTLSTPLDSKFVDNVARSIFSPLSSHGRALCPFLLERLALTLS